MYSDNEDEDGYESAQAQRTPLSDITETIRHKLMDRVRRWNDDDMFDYNEIYPLETNQPGTWCENTSEERNSSLRPTLSETCRASHYEHNVQEDDDDTDEEDICEKDFIRLTALKRYLALREGAIDPDADWFNSYEQDKWSTTAEASDTEFDTYDMMDIDEAEIVNKSPIDYLVDDGGGTYYK